MYITDYNAVVKINTTEIPDWTGFTVGKRLGEAEISASVDLQRPIDISDW